MIKPPKVLFFSFSSQSFFSAKPHERTLQCVCVCVCMCVYVCVCAGVCVSLCMCTYVDGCLCVCVCVWCVCVRVLLLCAVPFGSFCASFYCLRTSFETQHNSNKTPEKSFYRHNRKYQRDKKNAQSQGISKKTLIELSEDPLFFLRLARLLTFQAHRNVCRYLHICWWLCFVTDTDSLTVTTAQAKAPKRICYIPD